jgi:16S rRNA (uracil1498-N3)-methyltransferase
MTAQSSQSHAMSKRARLFIQHDLEKACLIGLEAKQAHYLVNVLRLKNGNEMVFFNGRDGEWCARICAIGRKTVQVECIEQIRPQIRPGSLRYLFAPLKTARLDYLAQKATEMGVARLSPVLTAHTAVHRVNLARLQANTIEAAEQCGLLSIPTVDEVISLEAVLADWPQDCALIYCDEAAAISSPLKALETIKAGHVAVLIGPEGGFSEHERRLISNKPFVKAISLGPRILRADTAAVAALGLIQAQLGDWR